MKKIYLSILTALAGFSLHAQLTQANQAPTVGYSYQLFHCDSSAAVSPGASGANANWNFSTITTYSNLVSNFATASISNASFPSATVAVASSPSNTSYYSSTATNLNYYGGNVTVGPVSATLIYTTAAVVASYPMNLNTTNTSAIGGTINVVSPPVSGTFLGNCKILADGSGTLTLPGTNSTFTNVLRVVTSQTINVTVTSPPISGTLTEVTYDYYAAGIRNPIFTIATATANIPGFGVNTQTVVTRDKNAVNTVTTTPPTGTVGINEASATVFNLNVYPNPSSSYVQFATESVDAKQVSIYDVTGKLIDRQNFTDGKIKLDVSELNIGLYIYTVTGTNNRALKTGKITVNH